MSQPRSITEDSKTASPPPSLSSLHLLPHQPVSKPVSVQAQSRSKTGLVDIFTGRACEKRVVCTQRDQAVVAPRGFSSLTREVGGGAVYQAERHMTLSNIICVFNVFCRAQLSLSLSLSLSQFLSLLLSFHNLKRTCRLFFFRIIALQISEKCKTKFFIFS